MSGPIANMVREMLARGVAHDVIVLAVEAAEQASLRVEIPQNSADASAERRRARDRDRKRLSAETLRKSVEIPQNSTNALTLTSLTSSELEVKKEKKVRARKQPAGPLSAEFQPKESHFEAAQRLHIPRSAVFEKAEDMRLWAQSTGALKVDWDATLHGFLRRDASKLSTNGNGNGTHHAKPGSVPDIARRHAEYFEAQAESGDSFEGNSGALFRLPQR